MSKRCITITVYNPLNLEEILLPKTKYDSILKATNVAFSLIKDYPQESRAYSVGSLYKILSKGDATNYNGTYIKVSMDYDEKLQKLMIIKNFFNDAEKYPYFGDLTEAQNCIDSLIRKHKNGVPIWKDDQL
jgi:hypothetical protein